MAAQLNRHFIIGSLVSVLGLTGCVSQGKYDDLQAQNQQLQQQNAALSQELAANKAQVTRLQGAIKYTVNSDLLFPPGGWQMSTSGKQIIAKMAAKLAPTQQNKIMVNGYTDNAPIGPKLQQEGVTSNEILSQKRAENVTEYLISQGLNPSLVEAHGFGDASPVASNDTAKGRAENRRVELTVAGG
jgi:chemotaxis protein MotB